MKKIIVNGRFLLRRITGVERYAREILAELDNLIQSGEIEMAIPSEARSIPVYKNIKVVRIGRLHNRLWEQISFPSYVNKMKGISLNLCNVAPILSPGIVCIHDLKVKTRPQDFSKRFTVWYSLLLLNACKRAKRIITVSEFSKKEICKYYKVNPNKVTVIPNAWQHFQRIGFDETALNKYGLAKNNYYFAMCSLEPNKNIRWIAETAKNNFDQIFAVAGSINNTVFAEGLGFERPENMRLLGYVNDKEAKTLMRDCKAFLFPTFYEGFGIPPLEAICAGCKHVIVSNIDVMHEVFKDSVSYIDPEKPELPKEGSQRMNGHKILSKYSWGGYQRLAFCD